MEFLHSLIAFILAIGVLITVHEFGHYWVARRAGVKILRFSIGFGRPLWTRRFGPDRTELVLTALPLGGYVKMLDEREGEVAPEERRRAFNRQPLFPRIAIVLAGPLANFVFAVLAFSVMYLLGVVDLKPLIGEVTADSIAARAGLRNGQEIVAVGGEATPTWESVLERFLQQIIERRELVVRLRDSNGEEKDAALPPAALQVDDLTQGAFFKKLGIQQYRPKYAPMIQEVAAGGAADRAGLRAGDRIEAADGQPLEGVEALISRVEVGVQRPIVLDVRRDGRRLAVTVVPEPAGGEHGTVGRINVRLSMPEEVQVALRGVERYGLPQAVVMGFTKSWEMSVLTVDIFGRMILREVSVKNISGPISIARYAGQSAKMGVSAFCGFLAAVSVSLFVLNLLPIPLLDGGHLMYYLIEFVTRRPVSEAVQAIGQQVGFVLLLALIGLAFYNDLARFL